MVEALMDAGLAVYVVPPRQVKALRERYGSAGNKDDRFDAYLLADTLRSDGHRWRPLREDSDATRRCERYAGPERTSSRSASGSSTSSGPTWNWRSRADWACSPSPTARSPSASCDGSRLQRKQLGCRPSVWIAWLRSVGYNGGIAAEVLYARLAAAAPGLVGAEADARGQITLCLVSTVGTSTRRSLSSEDLIAGSSPPTPINTSSRVCPGRGRSGQRASWLRLAIAVSGSRPMVPSPASLVRVPRPASRGSTSRPFSAGRATRNSAPPSWISRTAVAWRPLGRRHLQPPPIDRGCRHPHAIRILARAWLRIIWRCWQDGIAFDPNPPSSPVHRGRLDIGHSYVCQALLGCRSCRVGRGGGRGSA